MVTVNVKYQDIFICPCVLKVKLWLEAFVNQENFTNV